VFRVCHWTRKFGSASYAILTFYTIVCPPHRRTVLHTICHKNDAAPAHSPVRQQLDPDPLCCIGPLIQSFDRVTDDSRFGPWYMEGSLSSFFYDSPINTRLNSPYYLLVGTPPQHSLCTRLTVNRVLICAVADTKIIDWKQANDPQRETSSRKV
jgi:hypothetical protein